MTQTRQFLLVLTPLLILFGCEPAAQNKAPVGQDWNANVRAQTYMQTHFPGLQFQTQCPDDLYFWSHGNNINLCTITAGPRIFTLGCSVQASVPTGCALLAATTQ